MQRFVFNQKVQESWCNFKSDLRYNRIPENMQHFIRSHTKSLSFPLVYWSIMHVPGVAVALQHPCWGWETALHNFFQPGTLEADRGWFSHKNPWKRKPQSRTLTFTGWKELKEETGSKTDVVLAFTRERQSARNWYNLVMGFVKKKKQHIGTEGKKHKWNSSDTIIVNTRVVLFYNALIIEMYYSYINKKEVKW